jgi:hypothetical protein
MVAGLQQVLSSDKISSSTYNNGGYLMKRYQRVCVYGIVFLLGMFALPMAKGVAQKTATDEPIAPASGSHEILSQGLMVGLEEQQKFPALLLMSLSS